MNCDNASLLLYAVTDRAWVGRQSLYEQVECALKGGATCVQVREKKLGDEDFLEEALLAEREGADYLGVGAVFPTGTKADANAVSYDTLRDICAAVSIPVIAIGGITKDNVARLSGSGIVGVAVVSAIFAQPDIPAATRALKAAVRTALDL